MFLLAKQRILSQGEYSRTKVHINISLLYYSLPCSDPCHPFCFYHAWCTGMHGLHLPLCLDYVIFVWLNPWKYASALPANAIKMCVIIVPLNILHCVVWEFPCVGSDQGGWIGSCWYSWSRPWIFPIYLTVIHHSSSFRTEKKSGMLGLPRS